MSADAPAPSELTTTAAVTWPTLPIYAVHEFNVDAVKNVLVSNMHGVASRLNGRALGQIVGDIHCQIMPVPGASVAAAVGVAPDNLPATGTPDSTSEILACGGVCLYASSARSVNGSLVMLPGITPVLRGTDTTTAQLAGKPPRIYVKAVSAAEPGGSKPTTVTVVFRFNLRLEGYDWATPWPARSAKP